MSNTGMTIQVPDNDYAGGFPYNAVMAYGGKKLKVLITDFSYSYQMSMGSSQTRSYKASYPKWFRQQDPSMTLQFVNSEQKQKFVEWVSEWQRMSTSGSFSPISVQGNTKTGGSIDYDVLITKLTYSDSYNTPAQSITVNLKVVGDKWNSMSTKSTATVTGVNARTVDLKSLKVLSQESIYGDSAYGDGNSDSQAQAADIAANVANAAIAVGTVSGG